MHRHVLAVVWPLLLAASAPAPAPSGFVAGVSGIPRELDNALGDIRAAGFGAIRIFLGWDRIETVEGEPDWTCGYLTPSDLGPDIDRDGKTDPWAGIPCDGTRCGCGYSADERIAIAAGNPHHLPVLLTIVGTPAWARGARAAHCPAGSRARVLPLRRGKESAFRNFVGAVARRYGTVAYAFELWSEPDLAGCASWAGTRQQYKEQILSAATAVKSAGIVPGLVVAPTLEDPSGAAIDAWMDWSQPIDLLSFNIYTTSTWEALAKIEEMNAWCRANPRCPGFYITEFGARRIGASHCPGPRSENPGAADVAVMRRCRSRRRCAGIFLYTLSERTVNPECDRGLLDARGCRKHRLCTIARRFFQVPTLPFTCGGCGP